MQNKPGVLFGAVAAILVLSRGAAFGASVESSSGSVFLKAEGKVISSASQITSSHPLLPGQSIETGSDGKARLLLDDGSEITLASGSEFAVGKVESARGKTALSLLYGKLRALVARHRSADESWSLRAGNAVMGVRGTEFIVDHNRDRTVVCAFEGKVEVTADEAPRESVVINAGEGVVISSEGRITPPVAMSPRQMDWWRQETLADSSSSPVTRLRVLGSDWHWSGPTEVEQLDPESLNSDYALLHFKGSLWSRFNQAEDIPLGAGKLTPGSALTSRAAAAVMSAPTRNYLIFAQGTGTIKAGNANPENTGFRVHQAFLLFRQQSQHSIAIGRQEWEFGDGMMIGREPWSPFTRSYDGVLATLRAAPVRLRVFGSLLQDRSDKFNLEDWMLGAYAESSKFPLHLYAFWVKRDGANRSASANDLQTRHAIVGARSEALGWGPLFANGEFSYQRGTIGITGMRTATLDANFAYADGGVTWGGGRLSGLLKGVYLRASGDRRVGSDTFGGFIQLAPDTHRFLGLVNAFPQFRNIRRAGASVSARYLMAGIPATAQLDYSNFARVESADRVYPAIQDLQRTGLGDEIDLIMTLEPLRQLHLMAGVGWLMPGAAFGDNRAAAYLAFLMAQYRL